VAEKAYSRILLKLSGEALLGEEDYGIDPKIAQDSPQPFGRTA